MDNTLKTACCYNCKFLDEEDYVKNVTLMQYKCELRNSYRYKYSRCNEHQEKIPQTVIQQK